mmetsp:Transcript_38177/g.114135  ORF Transcript_38177/g.114135 Transcript_38177/m.114135 type:complete len:335 (+) Transcript_38177:1584-2588(+)
MLEVRPVRTSDVEGGVGEARGCRGVAAGRDDGRGGNRERPDRGDVLPEVFQHPRQGRREYVGEGRPIERRDPILRRGPSRLRPRPQRQQPTATYERIGRGCTIPRGGGEIEGRVPHRRHERGRRRRISAGEEGVRGDSSHGAYRRREGGESAEKGCQRGGVARRRRTLRLGPRRGRRHVRPHGYHTEIPRFEGFHEASVRGPPGVRKEGGQEGDATGGIGTSLLQRRPRLRAVPPHIAHPRLVHPRMRGGRQEKGILAEESVRRRPHRHMRSSSDRWVGMLGRIVVREGGVRSPFRRDPDRRGGYGRIDGPRVQGSGEDGGVARAIHGSVEAAG